jgi:hypothetical protein
MREMIDYLGDMGLFFQKFYNDVWSPFFHLSKKPETKFSFSIFWLKSLAI